jgi:OOP family OmpA-OmpF porin
MNRPAPDRLRTLLLAACIAACLGASPAWAAPGDKPAGAADKAAASAEKPSASGDKPVAPLPAGKVADDKSRTRNSSIPAKGLFVKDQLSESTKAKLTQLMLDAIGMRIELALLVPTGNWKIDGAGKGDNDLNAARLQALRRFLSDRGVDPKKIFVESRVDPKVKTPRLDVQLVVSPAND